MQYVYPAIFTPNEDGYAVRFPDLSGCYTCGETLAEAIDMAQDASELWLNEYEKEGRELPKVSVNIQVNAPEFVNFILADTEEYRKAMDNKAVKKTLSIPAWLNYAAEKANAPFSQILQQGLKDYLHV